MMLLKLIENSAYYDFNHNHLGLFLCILGLSIAGVLTSRKVRKLERLVRAHEEEHA